MKLDVKTLAIGILLGVCVMLSMGQRRAEPAQKLDADYRYQISVHKEQGSETVYILDHETKKIYARQFWDNGEGFDIKRAIERR